MYGKRGSAVLLGVVALMAFAGCAAQPDEGATTDADSTPASTGLAEVSLEGSDNARAIVDTENFTVTYPIDAYLMDDEASDLIAKAYYLELEACMTENGASYTVPTMMPSETAPPFRRYGLWDVDSAAAFGYGLDPTKLLDPGPFANLSESDAQVLESKCAHVGYLPLVVRGGGGADSDTAEAFLPAEIERQAFELASADDRWQAADDEWYACIEDNGFVADRANMGPQVPADPEGALRAAVVEATCSIETNRVQRLADIEAQYQSALIDEQQTALNSSVEEQKAILEQAKAIVEKYS